MLNSTHMGQILQERYNQMPYKAHETTYIVQVLTAINIYLAKRDPNE
jgi:hypothetical protein